MRLALSGTELDADEGVVPLADACGELDIGWVELWYPRNTELLGVERSLAVLEERGISVGCVATATELGGDGDVSAAQKTVTKAVELAARIGAGMVNTYFGWPAELDDERAIARYHENLLPCLRAAERAGVTITLENEFDAFGADPLGTDLTRRPAALRRLMDTVGSARFKIAFDPCNAYFAGVDPLAMLPVIADHVAYVHLKDGLPLAADEPAAADWRRFVDHDRHYATCAMGEGNVDWPALLGALTALGYDGLLALEPHSRRAALGAAWRQSAAFALGLLDGRA
jgi:sugar phosphate isomerase/epimerase